MLADLLKLFCFDYPSDSWNIDLIQRELLVWGSLGSAKRRRSVSVALPAPIMAGWLSLSPWRYWVWGRQ